MNYFLLACSLCSLGPVGPSRLFLPRFSSFLFAPVFVRCEPDRWRVRRSLGPRSSWEPLYFPLDFKALKQVSKSHPWKNRRPHLVFFSFSLARPSLRRLAAPLFLSSFRPARDTALPTPAELVGSRVFAKTISFEMVLRLLDGAFCSET